MKYLNWSSNEFKKTFESLLIKAKDENAYVQKATEQCLISLCKMEELRSFSKSLSTVSFKALSEFCQTQLESGNLEEIKLDIEEKKPVNIPQKMFPDYSRQESTKSLNINNDNSLLNLEKIRVAQ